MQFNKLFFAAPIVLASVGWAQPAADAMLSHSESSFLKNAAAGGIAEVKFAEWTSKGEMRQPVYLGLRADKQANDVVRERERPRKSARISK